MGGGGGGGGPRLLEPKPHAKVYISTLGLSQTSSGVCVRLCRSTKIVL